MKRFLVAIYCCRNRRYCDDKTLILIIESDVILSDWNLKDQLALHTFYTSIKKQQSLHLGLGWCWSYMPSHALTLCPGSRRRISPVPQGMTILFHNTYKLHETLQIILGVTAPLTPHMLHSLCIKSWSVTIDLKIPIFALCDLLLTHNMIFETDVMT